MKVRFKRLPHGIGFFGRIARGQRPGTDTSLLKSAHLITHQRNQRGNHNRHPIAQQRRKLKTQGFTAPRRHDGQNIFARRHGIHDLFLTGPEGIESKDIPQKGIGVQHDLASFNVGITALCATVSHNRNQGTRPSRIN